MHAFLPDETHFLRFAGPVNNVHEGPAIGNGDLAAMVQIFQNEFRLTLGKNDCWDARVEGCIADSVISTSYMKELNEKNGFRVEDGKPCYDTPPTGREYQAEPDWWKNDIHPCPKQVGQVSVLISGISSTTIETTVDIRRGIVTARYTFDHGWHGTGVLRVEAFVDKTTNRVALRIQKESGHVGVARFRIMREPEQLDQTVPLPSTRKLDYMDNTVTVLQTIPGEYDTPEFSWAIAGAFIPEGTSGAGKIEIGRWRVEQVINFDDTDPKTFVAGICTTRDGEGDHVRRASELAGVNSVEQYETIQKNHEDAWMDFWSASGVRLGDAELEATWYRNLFALSAHIAHGAMAPGLVANIPTDERSPWHGCYTVNMNIQKMFLPSMMSNHPEWIECYADWIDHMTPTFEYMAQQLFGFEGVHSEHMIFPFVPPHRNNHCNLCGRSIGMTGWHAQPLWWHWQMTRDRDFLRNRTYPFLKKVAQTYTQFIEKFMDDGTEDLYPTLNLEGPQWSRNFENNRDCFCDLLLYHNSFNYAIEAAEILEMDAELVTTWRAARERLHDLRIERLDSGLPWVYWQKSAHPENHPQPWPETNLAPGEAVTAAWIVFPGERFEGDEEEGKVTILREIMELANWKKWHPQVVWIHHWWCSIPALRMGLEGSFDKARDIILKERYPAGHTRTTHYTSMLAETWRCPEDSYLGVAATTEMLLQSQGETLRLFPAWPHDQKAAFAQLPARGGFLVDASFDPQKGVEAQITARADGVGRIRVREFSTTTLTDASGKAITAEVDGGVLSFPVVKGTCYHFAGQFTN